MVIYGLKVATKKDKIYFGTKLSREKNEQFRATTKLKK